MSWQIRAQTPANYTQEDPLDVDGMQNMVDDLHTGWWQQPPDQQRQAIANAFRAALVSPRQNLKWNSIVYQDLMHLPPDASDPDQFEQAIRAKKGQWDKMGQQTMDLINEHSTDPDHIAYAPYMTQKYQPGIWKNIRNASNVGPYIDQLRDAAMEDVGRGGTGRHFRQVINDAGIPGVGPKITAFTWLLLNPKQSRLSTIDVHMMRALGAKDESPATYEDYLNFERALDAQRIANGYDHVPLGVYQWAVWDRQRTPGWHQDHTPLRPLNPVDWKHVDWAPQPTRKRKQEQEQDPNQLTLGRWQRIGF